MPTQIQLRRDTAANWTSKNPVMAQGEIGIEYDTGKLKIGDGSTAWTSLAYLTTGGGGSGAAGGITDMGTLTSTATIPSGNAIVNANYPNNTAVGLTMPSAASLNGSTVQLRLTNVAGMTTYQQPTFSPASGDSLTWRTAQPEWNTAPGAVNIIAIQGADSTAAGGSPNVDLWALTSAAGPAQPLLLPTFGPTNSGSAITLMSPLAEQVQEVVVTAATTIQHPNFSTLPGFCQNFGVRLICGPGGPFTVTWASPINWAGGSPPTLTSTVGRFDEIWFTERVSQKAWAARVVAANCNSGLGPFTNTANNGVTTLNNSATTTAVTLNNVAVGDLVVFITQCFTTNTLVSVSGGGVGGWLIAQQKTLGADSCAIAWGIVTATGTQTATVTMSGNAGGDVIHGELAPTVPGTISVDGAGQGATASGATSLTLPTLTPSGTKELIIVGTYPVGGGTVGGPSGFTAVFGSSSAAWYLGNVSSAQTPALTQSTSGNFLAVEQMFTVA